MRLKMAQTLHQALPEALLYGSEQSRAAVCDHEQRRAKSSLLQVLEEALPGVC